MPTPLQLVMEHAGQAPPMVATFSLLLVVAGC
jgi:hypothetical protein